MSRARWVMIRVGGVWVSTVLALFDAAGAVSLSTLAICLPILLIGVGTAASDVWVVWRTAMAFGRRSVDNECSRYRCSRTIRNPRRSDGRYRQR